MASELVGPGGKVFAFEPLQNNIHYLKEHLRINRCDNVIIIEAAVTSRGGISFFEKGTSNYTGKLSWRSDIKVNTVSLDDLASKGEIPPPDYIKIDVEGTEMLVLSGAKQILTDFSPTIFLATHGVEMHQQCCEFLNNLGYDLKPINKKKSTKETDEILAFKRKINGY